MIFLHQPEKDKKEWIKKLTVDQTNRFTLLLEPTVHLLMSNNRKVPNFNRHTKQNSTEFLSSVEKNNCCSNWNWKREGWKTVFIPYSNNRPVVFPRCLSPVLFLASFFVFLGPRIRYKRFQVAHWSLRNLCLPWLKSLNEERESLINDCLLTGSFP